MLLIYFLFGFYCRRLAPNYFFKNSHPRYVLPVMIRQKKSLIWSAGSFCPDLEQSEPGLLSHNSAPKLSWD